MDAFWTGLIGATVGGGFTVLGAWFQARSTLRASRAQVELTAAFAMAQRKADLSHAAHVEVLRELANAWSHIDFEAKEELKAIGARLLHVVTVYGSFLSGEVFKTTDKIACQLAYEENTDPDFVLSGIMDVTTAIRETLKAEPVPYRSAGSN